MLQNYIGKIPADTNTSNKLLQEDKDELEEGSMGSSAEEDGDEDDDEEEY